MLQYYEKCHLHTVYFPQNIYNKVYPECIQPIFNIYHKNWLHNNQLESILLCIPKQKFSCS